MAGLFVMLFLNGLLLALKAVKFTGAWISLLLVYLIDDLLMGKLVGIRLTPEAYPEIYPIYEMALIVLMLIPIVIVTSYHIYRIFKPVQRTPPPPPVREPEYHDPNHAEKLRELQAMAAQLRALRNPDGDNN